ncbi:MFS transporter [Streptomyces sp. NBC_00444]|uniref:MFS transporter n=1 Tax=Streptomyces sp. NBC_00444 TaxID=2975744 RepID=UPI002E214197
MSETPLSYRTTLSVARAKGVLGLGILSRLPAGVVPFSVLMAFTEHYGIGIAGVASGALMLAIALPGAARARWASRRGPAALPLMAVACLILFAAAAAVIGHAPWQAAIVVTAAAGCLFPPLTPTLRSVWSRLMPDKDHLQRIHTLDSTVEELTFVATPLLVSAGMALSDTRLTLIVGAILLLPAALGLAAVLRSLPADQAREDATQTTVRRQRSILRTRNGRGIIVPVLTLGLFAGGLEVIIPAASSHFGGLSSSGYAFAAFSVGGVVGGLAYGRKTWVATLRIRYVIVTAGLIVGALLLAVAAQSPLIVLVAFCAGLPMTPIFVVAYLLVDERIEASRQTEANAWLGSGFNVGSASGAALGGQLLALTGPRLVAVALAAVASGSAAVAYRISTTQEVSETESAAEPNVCTAESGHQSAGPKEAEATS